MHLKFENDLVCLDLSNSFLYKQKKKLIDLIIANGGRVSFILNKKISYLIKDQNTNLDSYKCRTAFKHNIPVVHVNYIYELNDTNSIKDYLIKNKLYEDSLRKGLIPKSNLYFKSIIN
jgi:hypothetical protein